MRGRSLKPSALLARIRGIDLRSRSDTELRDYFGQLRSLQDDGNTAEVLCNAFAIIAEVVDRRLGVWRAFDACFVERYPLSPSPGDAVVISDAKSEVNEQRRYRRDGDISLPAEFYAAVRSADQDGEYRFLATDEQLLAGIHISKGKVVQMDAGEGKTVAAALAAVLHTLNGRTVHLITANDYLADRDAKLLEPVCRCLGLSVGALLQHMEEAERRQIYGRNIVYGAMRELGFDYLRDNLKTEMSQRVQPVGQLDGSVGIVDEADHALIDEAATPMIISGNPTGSVRAAVRADRAVREVIRGQREVEHQLSQRLMNDETMSSETDRLAARLLLADPDNPEFARRFAAQPRRLRKVWRLAEDDCDALSEGLFYVIHPGQQFVTLTDRGRDFLEERLGPLYEGSSTAKIEGLLLRDRRRRAQRADHPLSHSHSMANQVLQSLRAHLLLKPGVDYVTGVDEVVLIDQHTGRAKPDNIYQHGLQAAVEAKERVKVRPDSETLAWTTVSGFMSRYGQVSGVTGTAVPAAEVFRRRYGLEVAVVPPAKVSRRTTLPPRVYLSREEKNAAVVGAVAERARIGQPVLVAARTVEQSEELSLDLSGSSIHHSLLNAVTSASEARIVRQAGDFGSVTVATSMAGRGTDIVLEPGLTERLAQRCVEQIQMTLSQGAAVVEIEVPAEGQAEVLRAALQHNGLSFVSSPLGEGVCLSIIGDGEANRSRLQFALGLYVIGTEIYESRRTELQLQGRSGRQGEFGLAQTLLSLEDSSLYLHADEILKLSNCQQTDYAGRTFFTGPKVSRVVERLQAEADSEEEAVRGLLNDYAAEFDRQTHLYHQRRNEVAEASAIYDLCLKASARVAARLVAAHVGTEADEDYRLRFQRMAEEARLDYGVDCTALYGGDLALLPMELLDLFSAQLEQQSSGLGERGFSRVARLLLLQVCGELWPRHLDTLRDLMASQMLSGMGHKSAVAQYIGRCQDAWRDYWVAVDSEFVSRLMTLALSPQREELPILASRETEALLAQNASSPI